MAARFVRSHQLDSLLLQGKSILSRKDHVVSTQRHPRVLSRLLAIRDRFLSRCTTYKRLLLAWRNSRAWTTLTDHRHHLSTASSTSALPRTARRSTWKAPIRMSHPVMSLRIYPSFQLQPLRRLSAQWSSHLLLHTPRTRSHQFDRLCPDLRASRTRMSTTLHSLRWLMRQTPPVLQQLERQLPGRARRAYTAEEVASMVRIVGSRYI